MDSSEAKALTAEAIALAIECVNFTGGVDAEKERAKYMTLARYYGVEKLVLELRHGRNAADA